MKKLRKIQHNLQDILNDTMNELLTECEIDYNSDRIIGHIVDLNQGRSHKKTRQFTVPLWAYNGSAAKIKGFEYTGKEGYFKYYVAHELSHQLAGIKYPRIKMNHNRQFYEVFINICPKELQYFELYYKPSAAWYGIK